MAKKAAGWKPKLTIFGIPPYIYASGLALFGSMVETKILLSEEQIKNNPWKKTFLTTYVCVLYVYFLKLYKLPNKK